MSQVLGTTHRGGSGHLPVVLKSDVGLKKQVTTMARGGRRDDILSAATQCFADEGYDRTTLRTIASAAGVKLSLVAYHFETKLGLYRAVFERYQYVNEARLVKLRAVDLGAPGALDEVIDAFLHIGTLAQSDSSLTNYRRLVLREASDPASSERGIIVDLFDPMANEFIQCLETLLPGRPAGALRWSYLFAVGALTGSINDSRERALSAGESSEVGVFEALKSFLRAAWTA